MDFSKLKSVKKYLLLFFLLLCAITILKSKDHFSLVKEYYALNFAETKYDIGTSPETTVKQTFIAKDKELEYVYVRFYIEDLIKLKGNINVSLCDAENNVIRTRTKPLSSLIQTETASWTEFYMPCELEKGKVYSLVISTSEVQTNGGKICLYLSKNRGFLFQDLSIDQKNINRRTESTFKYNSYCKSDTVKMMILLILTAILVVLFSLREVHTKLISRFLFLLTPVMAFWMMQSFSSYYLPDFCELLFSVKGLINIILYGTFCLIAYVLLNRTKYAIILVMTVTYLAGLINYFVWNFRECPIMAADFSSLGTAMNVASNYEYTLGVGGAWATTLFVVYLCITMSLTTCKGMSYKQRLSLLLVSVLCCSGLWTVFFKTDLMKKLDISVSVWQPDRDYARNGSALSFLLSCTYYIVEKPDGYSPEKVTELTKKYKSDPADNKTIKKEPNIIAIMNESFADLGVDCKLDTTEDYMPFLHNLKENTVKGNLYVSVLGGNTANTEFEFLTGNSLAFFPTRSVPYNSFVKEQTGSLTWSLKQQGYVNNSAVHPYYSDGWNREMVYPLLGFDNFLSQLDFTNNRYVREFISDESDYNKLIELYEQSNKESDQPFYEFSVTMQNHGGYLGTHGLAEENIQVTEPANVNDQVTQYINLIKESDTAFEQLIQYFSKVKEPTIIVMFGDHQPGFTDSVYDSLMKKPTSSLNIEETSKMYQVPYIIWANYDIPEEERDMSANYLSSYLLKLSGNQMTGYNKYLLDLMDKVPVISAICYKGDDGVVHAPGEESKYSEYLKEYQMIQYNNMFDTKNRVKDFYFLKK